MQADRGSLLRHWTWIKIKLISWHTDLRILLSVFSTNIVCLLWIILHWRTFYPNLNGNFNIKCQPGNALIILFFITTLPALCVFIRQAIGLNSQNIYYHITRLFPSDCLVELWIQIHWSYRWPFRQWKNVFMELSLCRVKTCKNVKTC